MKNKKLNNIKSSGFKVPKDYFDNLESNFFNELKAEQTFFDVTSSGFKVPNKYFDTIEDNILHKISEENKTKVIPLFFRKKVIYATSIAAAVLLLFNLSIFDNSPSFDDLKTETVENYIFDDDISSYEIASLISDELLNENDFVEHNLDEKNIEEYLLDNADIESLIIE